MTVQRTFLTLAAALALAACNPTSSGSTPSRTSGELRAEEFCSAPDLKPALRHTYLLIDEKVISPSSTGAEFVEKNSALREVVLNFSDPARALPSGASDYRERISVHILPADGSAAYRVFSGCVPGLSPDELAAVRAQSSSMNTFFTGGVGQKLENESDAFRTKLIGALLVAGQRAESPARPQTGVLGETSVFQSLRSSGRMINSDLGVPRMVLLTDLSGINLPAGADRPALRAAGFADGAKEALDLGRADIVLVQSNPAQGLMRDYVDAFLLAQHARLVYWGNERIGALPTAPAEVRRYVGSAAYPSGPETSQFRLAIDRDGKLVNAWLILRGRPDRSTPLTGNAVCDLDGTCTLRSDEGGFAQAWSLDPGGEPEFENTMPFAGLRDFEIIAGPEKLTGRVFDPAVVVSGADGDSISLEGSIQPDATF